MVHKRLQLSYRRQLALISNLFKKQWLTKDDQFGFSQNLDANALKRLFNSTAVNYCEKVLERTSAECHHSLKGCGINDDCGLTHKKCIDDPSSAKGYKCKQSKYLLLSFSFYQGKCFFCAHLLIFFQIQ